MGARQLLTIGFLMLGLGACAAAPEQDARLLLGPKSTAQIEAWGRCANIENRLGKNAALYIPLSNAEGWESFTSIPSREGGKIRVRPCTSSPRS